MAIIDVEKEETALYFDCELRDEDYKAMDDRLLNAPVYALPVCVLQMYLEKTYSVREFLPSRLAFYEKALQSCKARNVKDLECITSLA